MNLKLVTTVVVDAWTYFVWLVTGGNVTAQTNYLADAGKAAPTHVATCPVRIDPGCLSAARDAGVNVQMYERLSFPVWMASDAGANVRNVFMPPMRQGLVRDCVETVDWSDCTLVTAASKPAVAAKWGNALPFGIGNTRKCVRQKADAGLPCTRLNVLPDGGSGSFGDRNVFLRSEAVNPAQCETCECSIFLGDNPESDL